MVKKILSVICYVLLLSTAALANESAQGWCETGNRTVTVGGLISSTKVMQSFSSCTVTVYNHGTATLATIYSDNATPPTAIAGGSFTASTNGHWQFYAANGNYDVVLSGGGFPSPLTLSDIVISSTTQNCMTYPGINTGTAVGTKIYRCIQALAATGGIADARGFTTGTISVDVFAGVENVTLLCGSATFTTTTTISIPERSSIVGPRSCVFQSTISSGNELFRAAGDQASIRGVAGIGTGQVANHPDGNRCIWIGAADHTTAANHVEVDDVECSQFTGNAVYIVGANTSVRNSYLHHNTDANIFCPLTCTYPSFDNNDIDFSRYSGIDINGNNATVTNNRCNTNGGGNEDLASWSCIAVISISDVSPASFNVIGPGNNAKSDLGCGILVFGLTTGLTVPARGNIIKGNVTSGHTYVTSPAFQLPGGICLWGGDGTIVEGNSSAADRDGMVITGGGAATSSRDIQVKNNYVDSPTRHCYHFTYTPRIDGMGDFPVQNAQVSGNSCSNSVGVAYRFQPNIIAWDNWTIGPNNKCRAAGTYCFENTLPTVLKTFDFQYNGQGTYGTAYQTGFGPATLTPDSTTPSCSNGTLFKTANTVATTIANCTGGVLGQPLTIEINDNQSTIDFTSSGFKGNAGADAPVFTGDSLNCQRHDGTSWVGCSIAAGPITGGFAQGGGASITQLTNKSTGVTLDTLYALITLNNQSINSGYANKVSFTWTNSYITANSNVTCNHHATGTAGAYNFTVIPSAGTAAVTVWQISGGALGEAVVVACRVYPTQ